MRIDLARLGAWCQTKWDRLRAKHITVGGLIGFSVTFAAVVATSFYPVFRSEKLEWNKLPNWIHALGICWVSILAAIYLKYSEALKRRRVWDRSQKRRRIGRQIVTGKALRDLAIELQNGLSDAHKIHVVRESLLHAAALGVEELLGLGPDNRVVANLLEIAAPDHLTMKVVCRSTKERPMDVVYQRDNLIAWAAIRDARATYIDDVTTDPRWQGMAQKPYRSVFAVPIGYGGRACAALTIDCDVPYAFYAHTTDTAIQLEPYAATLALTYQDGAYYHECKYEPHHSP